MLLGCDAGRNLAADKSKETPPNNTATPPKAPCIVKTEIKLVLFTECFRQATLGT